MCLWGLQLTPVNHLLIIVLRWYIGGSDGHVCGYTYIGVSVIIVTEMYTMLSAILLYESFLSLDVQLASKASYFHICHTISRIPFGVMKSQILMIYIYVSYCCLGHLPHLDFMCIPSTHIWMRYLKKNVCHVMHVLVHA